jgi:hypothetical protein
LYVYECGLQYAAFFQCVEPGRKKFIPERGEEIFFKAGIKREGEWMANAEAVNSQAKQ